MTLSNIVMMILLVMHFFIALSVAINKKQQSSKDRLGYSLGQKEKVHVLFLLLCLILSLLVAYRPVDIVPDADAYLYRYENGYLYTNLVEIWNNSSFFRGTAYSMSKVVNTIFFCGKQISLPYHLFCFLVACIELFVYFHYTRKICILLNIDFDKCMTLVLVLAFYSYRYQFVAFAQGMGMCLIAPVTYELIRKDYIKTILFALIMCSVHLAEFYVFAIILVYLLSPRLKNRHYLTIWIVIGMLNFSGFFYNLGGRLISIASIAINHITTGTTLYEAYAVGDGGFIVSLSDVLLWVALGVFIFCYNEKEEYWKLINVVLVSVVLKAVFSRWGVVHRFTDNSNMLIPIIGLLYFSDSKPIFFIQRASIKEWMIIFVCILELVSNLRLLNFV